eukprot:TRINITY_DN12096_c0_g6_i1.p1 TRINITY_DN12096_c0_g6~~TRINITY_DN12096_c0_g6_i1.p1  ORF type:complete len:650 (+),score=71.33 TRINITY_DN12096_c0_g6_i1:88-1950(+)
MAASTENGVFEQSGWHTEVAADPPTRGIFLATGPSQPWGDRHPASRQWSGSRASTPPPIKLTPGLPLSFRSHDVARGLFEAAASRAPAEPSCNPSEEGSNRGNGVQVVEPVVPSEAPEPVGQGSSVRKRNATPREGERIFGNGDNRPCSSVGPAPGDAVRDDSRSSESTEHVSSGGKGLRRRGGGCLKRLLSPFALFFGLVLVLKGALLLQRGLADDTRARRIQVFQELINQNVEFSMPVPVVSWLRASWALRGHADENASSVTFRLQLEEVPLSPRVVSDSDHPDDEMRLPFGSNVPAAGETRLDGTTPVVTDSLRSLIFRGSVPLTTLLSAANVTRLQRIVQPTILRVWLPDGRFLLMDTPVLIRDLYDGPEPRQQFAARFCYAVAPINRNSSSSSSTFEGGDWHSAVPAPRDCEYTGVLSSSKWNFGTYVLADTDEESISAERRVEIVVRSISDPYIHASEVTAGCSNCYGHPYGDQGPTGLEAHACHAAPHVDTSLYLLDRYPRLQGILQAPPLTRWIFSSFPGVGRCFGQPPRRVQAVALLFISSGCVLLALIWQPRLVWAAASLVPFALAVELNFFNLCHRLAIGLTVQHMGVAVACAMLWVCCGRNTQSSGSR